MRLEAQQRRGASTAPSRAAAIAASSTATVTGPHSNGLPLFGHSSIRSNVGRKEERQLNKAKLDGDGAEQNLVIGGR